MSTLAILRALAGGGLIGLAASLALVGNGRIAGICGIAGRVFDRDEGQPFRVAFMVGLIGIGLIAAVLWPAAIGAAAHGPALLIPGGLLVGFGTMLSSGCTSGHGVCGLARGSKRSLVAVMTFMGVAALTVALVGALR
jgi:uncharacterized membrane protein YedE/YeeE